MQGRRKGGLGRGLEALIPGSGSSGHLEVELDAIAPNPAQPRTTIAAEALAELAESLRQHGVIQPLLVTRRPAGQPGPPYLLVAGERRWRAARLAGLTTVPVVVREAAPQAMLELALVENLQRQDLNPLEEADAFQHLLDDFGLTQEQIAQRVGKSRGAIANTLRLRDLPDRIKAELVAGQTTEGHARALLGLRDDADRLAAYEEVRRRDLTVRQTEELVRQWGRRPPAPAPAAPTAPPRRAATDPDLRAIENRLQTALSTRVELQRRPRGQGGRLIIHFYSDEEFDHLYQRLVGDDQDE